MGQQPNIELEISDLPRPTRKPAPARRWRPDRPGDVHSPDDAPWGGYYGTTGPDPGYALSLIAMRDLPLQPGEHRSGVEPALAAIVGARASRFGRAPMAEDVDVALLFLGLALEALPSEVAERLVANRKRMLTGAGHARHKVREMVSPIALLSQTPEQVRAAIRQGAFPA